MCGLKMITLRKKIGGDEMGIIGLKVIWCKKGDWNTQTEGTEISNWQL
jgi:hypothetical protein